MPPRRREVGNRETVPSPHGQASEYVDPYSEFEYSAARLRATQANREEFERNVNNRILGDRNTWFRNYPAPQANQSSDKTEDDFVETTTQPLDILKDCSHNVQELLRFEKTVRCVIRFVILNHKFNSRQHIEEHLRKGGLRVDDDTEETTWRCTIEPEYDEGEDKTASLSDVSVPNLQLQDGLGDQDPENDNFQRRLIELSNQSSWTEDEQEEYESIIADHLFFWIHFDSNDWIIRSVRASLQ